jgi:hypothetical protein
MAESTSFLQSRIKRLCLAASLLALSVSAEASAQSAADMETARTLYQEARATRDAGDLKGALEKFRGAFAVVQTPLIALEYANTQVQLGMLVEARELLLGVARMKPLPNESQFSMQARTEAETTAEDLKARIPSVVIRFEPPPAPNAAMPAVFLDGNAVQPELLGLPKKLNPGSHKVEVRSAGAVVETKDFSVVEKATATVLLLTASAVQGPAATKVEAPSADPTQGAHIGIPLAFAGFGVAGAGLVLGSVAGIISFSKGRELDTACAGLRCPPSAQPLVTSGRTWATVSTLSFALAGVGAGVGIVGLVLHSRENRVPPASPGARLGFGLGSVTLEGRF